MSRLKILTLCVLSAILSNPAAAKSLQSTISAFEARDCAPVVDHLIDKQSIRRSDIVKIEYLTIQINPGDDFSEEYDYESWISFGSCKGNYVISMDRACFIKHSYATHECNRKGAYRE